LDVSLDQFGYEVLGLGLRVLDLDLKGTRGVFIVVDGWATWQGRTHGMLRWIDFSCKISTNEAEGLEGIFGDRMPQRVSLG